MIGTKLLYLENFNLLTNEAKVISVNEENGQNAIILDQTTFYPQGGGQPYDTGTIIGNSGKFIVGEVRFMDGIVRHIGKFENGKFQTGDLVNCVIDKVRREINSRIHSAGHVVDMAVVALKLNWVPSKGFHFPEGPYIEYSGTIENIDKDKLKADIEKLCNEFINKRLEVKLLFIDKDKMSEICHFVPDNMPDDKPGRVVTFGDFGIPCGGTHVNNLSEINNITIRKIKGGINNIRVAYAVN